MDIIVSSEVKKTLANIKHRDAKLSRRIEKQLIQFQKNHRHPSLRTHKLSGHLQEIWSISIDRKMRMVYLARDDGAYFFDIGTYDEVYRT